MEKVGSNSCKDRVMNEVIGRVEEKRKVLEIIRGRKKISWGIVCSKHNVMSLLKRWWGGIGGRRQTR